MTQSEVGLQLNELSPSVHMTEDTINDLLNTNIRNAQYTIASANRVPAYLAKRPDGSKNDAQYFNQWNEAHFSRAAAVNQGNGQSKTQAGGMPDPAANRGRVIRNGNQRLISNGQAWVPASG
jgi:hypothetical protein